MSRHRTRNVRKEAILYGWQHQKKRRELKPYAVGSRCTRCGKPIEAGDLIDLDHLENSTAYRGWAHRSCNRRAGWQAMRNATSDPRPKVVTRW